MVLKLPYLPLYNCVKQEQLHVLVPQIQLHVAQTCFIIQFELLQGPPYRHNYVINVDGWASKYER